MSNKVGIESIGFSTTNAVFDLCELSKKINENPDKFSRGLCQNKMSVITPTDDIITMGYKASKNCLIDKKNSDIGMVILATESGIEASKSSAIEIHNLLKLPKECRCIDVKQACFSGTSAIMFAKQYIKTQMYENKIEKKVLVVMSDIAYYGLNTPGEPTQGCGAVAILVSSEPKICFFNDDSIVLTENKNDFYRPVFKQTPIYDGKFSIKCYLSMFKNAVGIYQKNFLTNNTFKSYFDYLVVHMPFSKMLDKCCKEIDLDKNKNENNLIKKYSSVVGNVYTASLYLSLLSLLENSQKDLSNKKIAMFSYGSGCECELFSITILPNYNKFLHQSLHKDLLSNRIELSYREYKTLLKIFAKREKKLNWVLKKKYLNYKTKKGAILEKDKNIDTKIALSKIIEGVREYILKE